MGHPSLSNVNTVKKNLCVLTTEQIKLGSAQLRAATKWICFQGLNTHALIAMTSLWRDLTTAQIGVFVVVNVSWRTAFSLPTKNARTVVVCLLR